MTERSLPHQDAVGDGGPYSAEQWHMLLETVGLATGANVGVVPGIQNELAVTSTGDNNITVNTGRALVEGVVYENDASESKTTNDPGGVGTTGRRAVLRLDVAARTVRIEIITSGDDVTTLPALTQSAGVTWEIPLAGFQIDPTGAITALTDEREMVGMGLAYGRYVSRAGQTRYSRPGWQPETFAAGGGGTIGADIIFFTPILLQESRVFDRIGVRVTTLAAGENTVLGIYNAALDSSGLFPTTLILQTAKLSVAVADPTDVEETISQLLPAGFYFLAQVVESNTPAFNAITAWRSAPVTPRGANLTTAGVDLILATTIDAVADYVNNGLPATAPAVTAIHPANRAAVILRDTS